MAPFGIGAGQLVGLVREARRFEEDPRSLLVVGPLADVLARALGAGAESPSFVRVVGSPSDAEAVIVVLAGAITDEQLRVVHEASRCQLPVIAVQTHSGREDDVPYVLAQHVVEVAPGEGFPVDRIASALADALGDDGVGLAARLPVLRGAVQASLVRRAAIRNVILAAAPWSEQRQLPLLSLAQTRLLMGLAAASGRRRGHDPREAALFVGAPLATAFATGVVARAVFRRLPVGGPITAGAVAGLGTVAVRALERAVSARR